MHAPFLYELLQFVFDSDRNYYDFIKLQEASNSLENNYNLIELSDFAKSHRQTGLSIRRMYKKSGHTLYEYESLYRLMVFTKTKMSLELGASVGMSGLSMSLANKKGLHTSVEGNSSLADCTNALFKKFGLVNAHCVNASFETFFFKYFKPSHV